MTLRDKLVKIGAKAVRAEAALWKAAGLHPENGVLIPCRLTLNDRLAVGGVLVGVDDPGFQSIKTAYATIKGFEVMRMFKKGQFIARIDAIGGGTEACFINRLFGLYA